MTVLEEPVPLTGNECDAYAIAAAGRAMLAAGEWTASA
jgi:hypothetical protein